MSGGEAAAPTETSVDEVMETRVAMVTEAAMTAEAVAALTQAAPTALPTTGFADEVGMPGLLALAVVFVVVIFLVRRLRASQA
jgi:hypothetical protein